MITTEQIEAAKQKLKLNGHHEHDDCIRIAYEWLAAQKKTKKPQRSIHEVKHLIEKWAGRYVSTDDVIVAAKLNPDIKGTYPGFNLSSGLTEPAISRLKGISEAFTQDQHKAHTIKSYKYIEPSLQHPKLHL